MKTHDREPDPLHRHLGGMAGGSLADLQLVAVAGSRVPVPHVQIGQTRSGSTWVNTKSRIDLRSSPAPVWILERNFEPGDDRLQRPVGLEPRLVRPGQLGLLDEFVHLLHHAGPHLE